MKELKRKIDLLLKKADAEALKAGVNIVLPEYEKLRGRLKKKLVEQSGNNYKSYLDYENGLEQEREDKKDTHTMIAIAETISEKSKNKERESEESLKSFKSNVDKIIDDFKKEIKSVYNNHLKDVSNSIKEIDSKIESVRKEKQQVVNTKEIFNTKETIREVDKTETDELRIDITTLQEAFGELWEKVTQIPAPKTVDELLAEGLMDVVRKDVDSLLGSPLRRMGMGLQGQIDAINSKGSGSGSVTSVASADGSITVTNPTTTVDLAVVSAPKLTTARTINGTSFDGTANITITAAAGTLTGTTLNSSVVTSSLTAVGTITSGGLGTGATIAGVTMSLGSDAVGDIYAATTSNVLSRIAAVATGQVLISKGTTTLPAWSATATLSQLILTANAITASGNAATIPVTSGRNIVTNNSAATLTITMTTTNAVNMQTCIVQILDASAVAQTITWVNTENSTVLAPTTSNGSTTLPVTAGFIYNSQTSKWRCVASA